MSTNPFRRSSLKEVNASANKSAPDLDGATGVPLSVDTRVPSSLQKHVNFASPPAIPISPASYPSSPESTRNSVVLSPPHHASITPTDYSQALQSDPFREDASNEENDSAIEEALQNAKTNSTIVASAPVTPQKSKEDAVKDTLSRFASAPRRPPSVHETHGASQPSQALRKSLDVDAFKRLLLTGESGLSADKTAPPVASSHAPQLASDSSSNTDTASISQRSILEGGHQPIDETPRSSYELDRVETDTPRPLGAGPGYVQELRKQPPPPPKPRHGRPVTESTNIPVEQSVGQRARDGNASAPDQVEPIPSSSGEATPRHDQEENSSPSGTKKRPPPPPLARRKSQNKTVTRPGITRSPSSRYSLNSESDELISPPTYNASMKMAPPPPPTRRPTFHQPSRRQSVDLPSTLEEDDSEGGSTSVASSRTPSTSMRASQASSGTPPPVPPPRKNQRSSRSSIDSQRPSLSILAATSSTRSSFEYARPPNTSTSESRNVSGSSNAIDILADLAALQREVDAARKQAG